MGCVAGKNTGEGDRNNQEGKKLVNYKPLFVLKRHLLERLGIDDDHYYSVFCTYRFQSSIRRDTGFVRTVEKMRGIELNTDKENLTKSVVSEVLSSGVIKPSM